MNFMRKCEDGEYSSLVGWIIGLGKKLRESNGRVQQLREELQSLSNWMVSRNITSWAPTHWDQENWLAIKMLYMYTYVIMIGCHMAMSCPECCDYQLKNAIVLLVCERHHICNDCLIDSANRKAAT